MSRERAREQRGQATLEVVALLPLLLVVACAGFAVLVGATAADQAAGAAQAGAMAVLQGGDPEEAARAALPEAARKRAVVRVRGRTVHVEVFPRLPLPALERRLAGVATAAAGPEPRS